MNLDDSVVKKEEDPISDTDNLKLDRDPLEDTATPIKKAKLENEEITIKEEPETVVEETINETVECDICEKRFNNDVELDTHVRIHF